MILEIETTVKRIIRDLSFQSLNFDIAKFIINLMLVKYLHINVYKNSQK